MDNQTPKLNKALVEMRKEISNPKFNARNPHFKNDLVTLSAVYAAIVPLAAEHGISIHQDLREAEGGVRCCTHICHESGEEKVFGPLFFPSQKGSAADYAGTSTYARRYHIMGVFCIVGEKEDDDGLANTKNYNEQLSKHVDNSRRYEMTEKQAQKLAKLVDDANLETGEGVDAFGEAWIELGHDEQMGFSPWITRYWPGGVSAAKQRMRDIMAVYRERNNIELNK